jgi:hypothetical protein
MSSTIERLMEQVNALQRRVAELETRERPTTTAWAAPTLLNSWANFGSGHAEAAYRIIDGIVYLRGTISGGTATAGTVLFTLPTGFRPASRLLFATISSTALGRVDVLANGDVEIRLGSSTFLVLNGISFPVGA